MTADHLSYQRATSVSLIGLAFQIVFSLAMLLYGNLGDDSGAVSGAIAMFLGVPIWLALALVFHQHKLERLEAIEAEAYVSSTAASASVFEESSTGENAQARKLAWMHKWFLPVVSLALCAGYIGLGLFLFMRHRAPLGETEFSLPAHGGWGISIGVALAVVGFVFARFVAGMAKQPVWSMLNAGAAASVGSALIGAALFISHFASQAIDQDGLLRYMPQAVNVYMIALGAEIALNFVLTLYRPRQAGEFLRSAFDSRILAFLAAPDRLAESISDAINYQFGFNVSSTWFYRLISRSMSLLVVLGLLVMWFMTSFAVVGAGEQGVLLRNGEKVGEPLSSGLVFKRPWPFDQVERHSAKLVTTLTLGTISTGSVEDTKGPILWTEASGVSQKYLIVQASRTTERIEGDTSGGLALMALEIPVQYVVSDLIKYLDLAQDGPPSDRDKVRREFLTALASRVATRELSVYRVDQILGPERASIADTLRSRIQSEFDRLDAGVEVLFAGMQGVRPPREVAETFEQVVAADRKSEAEIESARADAIRSLAHAAGDVELARQIVAQLDELERLKTTDATPEGLSAQEQRIMALIVEAGGNASIEVSTARSERWARHMSQRAKAILSEGQIAAYRASPTAYMTGLYTDALVEMLAEARVWISPFEQTNIVLDQTELGVDITGFNPSDLPTETEE